MDASGCLRCGSDRIIRGARVNDRGDNDRRAVLEVRVGFVHPDALMFKSPIDMELRANVCGACGHVELHVADPEALWAAFTQLPPQPRP